MIRAAHAASVLESSEDVSRSPGVPSIIVATPDPSGPLYPLLPPESLPEEAPEETPRETIEGVIQTSGVDAQVLKGAHWLRPAFGPAEGGLHRCAGRLSPARSDPPVRPLPDGARRGRAAARGVRLSSRLAGLGTVEGGGLPQRVGLSRVEPRPACRCQRQHLLPDESGPGAGAHGQPRLSRRPNRGQHHGRESAT